MKCKCDFRTYMVGDGCDECNPAKALEYARETIADLQAHMDMLAVALRFALLVMQGEALPLKCHAIQKAKDALSAFDGVAVR